MQTKKMDNSKQINDRNLKQEKKGKIANIYRKQQQTTSKHQQKL